MKDNYIYVYTIYCNNIKSQNCPKNFKDKKKLKTNLGSAEKKIETYKLNNKNNKSKKYSKLKLS